MIDISTHKKEIPDDFTSGQIWSISWGKDTKLYVVIKSLRENNFTACPFDVSERFYPSIDWECNSEYKVWPNIDFHFDYSLLHDYYGDFMSPEYFYALSSAKNEEELNNIARQGHINVCERSPEGNFSTIKSMIDKYNNFAEYSTAGIASIERYIFTQDICDLEYDSISKILEISKREAIKIKEGNLPFSENNYQKIESTLEKNLASITRDSKIFEELSMPWWKDSLIEIAQKNKSEEEDARSLIIKRACASRRSTDSEISEVIGNIIEDLLSQQSGR